MTKIKILYIDNRNYGHNQDLHVDFFSYQYRKKNDIIIPYGKHLSKFFGTSIVPEKNPNKQLEIIVKNEKPNCIITYNPNGSSYEIKQDNINLYKWCEDFLKNTAVPKCHFSTDFCRDGYRKDQVDWFKDLNFSTAFFRHKVALKYPIEIPSYWIPFSIDNKLYCKNVEYDIRKKNNKVGFLGAAHNSSKELYENRIAAIDFLSQKGKVSLSKIIDKNKFEREILKGKSYVKFLTSNLFGLTCGGTCNFMTAKYFQIPAAYSYLLCTNTDGLEIFPEETYITYDKSSVEELYEKIIEAEIDLKKTHKKIKELHNYVIQHHNHERRWLEVKALLGRIL